jgi:hypothetical protein
MNEKAENVSPVIDGHGDHAFARHVLAVIARLRTVAVLEAAAEDVDENREFLLTRFCGSPDVEVQAVLAHAVAAEPVVRTGGSPLHAPGSELVGIAGAAPVLDRLGLAPAKVSHRWLAEWDGLETAHPVLGRGAGFQDAVCRLDAIGSERRLNRDCADSYRGED